MVKNWQSKNACIACGVQGEGLVTIHHEASRGSAMELADDPRNHLDLCSTHHVMRHAIGQGAFIAKFPSYGKALMAKGWHYDSFRRKYILLPVKNPEQSS